MRDHDIDEARRHTLYMESDKSYDEWAAHRKSISCRNRDKDCEAHGLPCDVCNGYKPIRRVRTEMKQPHSDKTPAMRNALKELFPEQAKNIAEKKCATCGSTKVSHADFENELSRKEYAISGMCQKCQDSVFK